FLLVTLAIVASFSAFISNTVTTAAFLPVVVAAAGRAGVDKREILLPMAFASMLGGTITLFGTSTNLVMSAVMERADLGGIAPFELAPIGLPVTAVALVALALGAPRLLRTPGDHRADEARPPREYLSELHVPADSPEHGKALGDVTAALPMRVLGVVRGGETMPPDAEHVVAERDRIVVEGHPEALAQAQSIAGVELPSPGTARASPADTVLVEAAVPNGSRLVGRTLEEARLPLRYGLEPMALHRRPTLQRLTKLQLLSRARGPGSITRLPLAPGDVLLLRGPAARVRELGEGTTLLVLTGVEEPALRPQRAWLAIALFMGALAIGAAGLVPLAVAGLAGLLAMIVSGCVDVRRAFAIDWRVVLLIASMMALALAMEESGAARLVGDGVAWLAGFGGPRAVLAVLVVITIALSIPMSNQAAALVVFPIALSIAASLGVNPRTFAIGVTFAASCSLVTPLEPSAMLVYGAGRYRFADFFRVGGPLTMALVVALTIAVPLVWPFEG
ncbi:MAG TPA: SLC13 family permease, partial [Anaeromyxobacteraceae bacterium]|nr:SLC13 family permease [Anaeromyxobacteraceae bacterium]